MEKLLEMFQANPGTFQKAQAGGIFLKRHGDLVANEEINQSWRHQQIESSGFLEPLQQRHLCGTLDGGMYHRLFSSLRYCVRYGNFYAI